jgi:glycosyltransferase involved in cell wall biosynthesis
MKRLLMISYPFPPNSSAGATRSERFARYITEFGWRVEVITIRHRKDLFEDTARVDQFGPDVGMHFTRTVDPWLWLNYRKPNHPLLRIARSAAMRFFSFPDHMLLWVPFAVSQARRICRSNRIDAIYTTSPPHSSHLAGLILSHAYRVPWIADFRDPWTLNAYRSNGFSDRLLIEIEKVLEKAVLKRSAVILANTKANRHNMLTEFPFLNEVKVRYLPNGWEEYPKDIAPSEREGQGLTIVHAGTFYPRFNPYGLLNALSTWKNGAGPPDAPAPDDGSVRVVLLGSRDETTRRIVKEMKIEDMVEIRPWVSLDEARRIMSRADFLWTSLGTGSESSTYVPSKIFEYIPAGKPIIGFFPPGDAERIITAAGIGQVFTSDDPEPVIRFLESALQRKRRGQKIPYEPNLNYLEAMKVRNIVKRFSDILSEIN